METLTDVWPLFRLSIATERLELRVPRDDDIQALVSVARAGIHDPDQMPFENAWTDRPDDEFDLGFAQYFWSQRARWSADSWELPFAVFLDGEPIGVQQLTAVGFPVARTIGTGSWLAREVQGRGFGAEMRAAVLDLGFFGLGAELAITCAYGYNAASNRVSQKLGYTANGVRRDIVRGRPEEAILYRLARSDWEAFDHTAARVDGLDHCRHLFDG